MEILSLGNEVTVLEPNSFKQEVREILKQSLKNYQ